MLKSKYIALSKKNTGLQTNFLTLPWKFIIPKGDYKRCISGFLVATRYKPLSVEINLNQK